MMFLYLLKSAACLGLFLLFYGAVLENARMHLFKRFYLLVALVLSLLVPIITFTTYVEIEPIYYSFDAPYTYETTTPVEEKALDYWPLVLWSVYGLGALIYATKFIANLRILSKNINDNPKFKMGSIINVLLRHHVVPHTFFNYIFLNRKKFENNQIPKEVLLHEAAHAQQKHSIDIILVELLQIIFWFNPLFYVTKKAIKLNHEFLADQAVIGAGVATSRYQNILLDFASSARSNTYQPSMVNAIDFSFYSSIHLALFGKFFPFRRTVAGQVKKRFTVMKKRTSKKSIVLRSTLIIPLLALMIFGFSENKIVPVEPSNAAIETNRYFVNDDNLITIYINHNGKLLIKSEEVALENLASFLKQLNKELTKEERARSVHAIIKPYDLASMSTLLMQIEAILENYGVAQIDIAGPDTHTYGTRPSQNGATPVQIKEYNTLAKKYNAMPKAKRVVPSGDLNTLETIYRKMSESQKNEAQPFPECPDPQADVQDGATKKQVAAYNALAKKYNTMLEGDVIRIMKSDMDRMEYLHSLMTEDQRANAEPFPDFPEPPEPPTPPVPPVREDIEVDEIIEIPEHETIEVEEKIKVEQEVDEIIETPKNEALREEAIHEIVQNKDIYDHVVDQPSFISSEGKRERKMVSHYEADTEKIESRRQEDIPPPPPPFKIPEPRKNYSKALLKAFDDFNSSAEAYGKAISGFMKNKKGKRSDLWAMHDKVIEKYDQYVSLAVAEGLMPPPIKKSFRSVRRHQNTPPPPPPAPEPKNPEEHIMEMAAKGALFYFEGKEISVEQAKKLLRENKNINMNTRHVKGQKPVIKLSTKPIKIGYNSSNSNIDQDSPLKVALVSMRSNISKERAETGERILQFMEKTKNCIHSQFYYNGQLIAANQAIQLFIKDKDLQIAADASHTSPLRLECQFFIKS